MRGVYTYFSGFFGISGAGEVYKYFSGAGDAEAVYKYFSGAGDAGEAGDVGLFIYTACER